MNAQFQKSASRLFDLLVSLKFAVIIMVALTGSLIVATVLESLYDTQTAQYYVYRSFWFALILATLGIEILLVALSRWPWKKAHTAFLVAHLGIIMVLVGSFVTQKWGIDGQFRISEGETSAIVDLGRPMLVYSKGGTLQSMVVPWQPPGVSFSPLDVPGLPAKVVDFISHADPNIQFIPAAVEDASSSSVAPAVKLLVEGGAMRIKQEFWLWGGDQGWSEIQAGPATLRLLTPKFPNGMPRAKPLDGKPARRGPVFTVRAFSNSNLAWEAENSDGKIKKGEVALKSLPSAPIETGWKGGVTIRIETFYPQALSQTDYVPAKTLYGSTAPPSAIKLHSGDSQIWMGLGDRATLSIGGEEIMIGYTTERILLPFSVKLDRFEVERYEGTFDPKEYSSMVRVVTAKGQEPPTKISMNQPLHFDGITFYQASYEESKPRPVTSILSVNRDPGRDLKYWGSILLVFGSLLLFAKHYLKKKKT